jgi:hypothetical protein
MVSRATKQELLHLYRRLLRSAETYPSKNRAGIYLSIREDFKENKSLDPDSEKVKKQTLVAFKGLDQLRQFDGRGSTNFAVTLEQNPMPKPPDYDEKKKKPTRSGAIPDERKG